MVTQKPDCQQLLPGTAHMEPRASLAAATVSLPGFLSSPTRPTTPRNPDSPGHPEPCVQAGMGGAGSSLGLPSDPAQSQGRSGLPDPEATGPLARELLESKEGNKDAAAHFAVRTGPWRTHDPRGLMGWGAGRAAVSGSHEVPAGLVGRKAGGPLPPPWPPRQIPDQQARPAPPASFLPRSPASGHLPSPTASPPLPPPTLCAPPPAPIALIHPSIH